MPVYGTYHEMQNMGYPGQAPAAYVRFHDGHTHNTNNKQEFLEDLPPVSFPMGTQLNSQNFQELIMSQDYQLNIRKIFTLSWGVYKQHWLAFVLFTIFNFAVFFLPYVGNLIGFPLGVGIFIAVCNKIRSGNVDGELKYDHLFFGFLFYIPLIFITLFSVIVYAIGLLLCIVPGVYAMFVLAFSVPVFLEYHIFDVGVIGAMILSQRVVNKHFIDVAAFLLVNFLFVIAGLLCFGVGGLITVPMGQINIVFAFREMFGINAQKIQEKRCVIC